MGSITLGSKKILVVSNETETNMILSEGDKNMDARANKAVEVAIEKAVFCGKPVAKYDTKEKKAYLEYPNGVKEYV